MNTTNTKKKTAVSNRTDNKDRPQSEMRPTIGIIDYGAGNVRSVSNALDALDARWRIVVDRDEAQDCSALILPGVGSFGYCMQQLRRRKLIAPLRSGIPLLGICLGMQVLFERSEESPGAKGLCLLAGTVEKLQARKVPHVGWNQVSMKRPWPSGYAYFVHSYCITGVNSAEGIHDAATALGTTRYGTCFRSAVTQSNVTGFQFHPEKSGSYGLALLRRWLTCLPRG